MHASLRLIAAAIALLVTLPTFAEEKAKPVRLGAGVMTFETVPGWGLRDGKSILGSTHGGVVIDRAGSIYVSANKGVVVFAPDGTFIKEYVGKDFTSLHDMEIRTEGDQEFIYGARNAAAEGIKFNAHTGAIAFKLPFPTESGLTLAKFSPTAITVAPNGDIFLSDGYASNHIFVFDKNGKYIRYFGEKGNDLKQFNTAHGMTLDTRYEPPRLLVCDRNHTPQGRLLHYSLGGEFLGEVITGLGMPTSAAVQGDYVAVPDLKGGVVVIGKDNKLIATLGTPKGANFKVTQDQWVEGELAGTHGSYWDKDGNLYVQDWNVDGRIMKFVRVK